MRYRKLSDTGDYIFGSGSKDFLINSPATVGQAVLTRLRLFTGEWFLDTTEGTPYFSLVIGFNAGGTRDQAIKQRILGTQGVVDIINYASDLNVNTRKFSVTATINTIYGTVTVTA